MILKVKKVKVGGWNRYYLTDGVYYTQSQLDWVQKNQQPVKIITNQ